MSPCPTCANPECGRSLPVCCVDCGRGDCAGAGCIGTNRAWPGVAREPKPEPVPVVKPCEKCGSVEFRKRKDYRSGQECRYCVTCRRLNDLAYRSRNLDRRRTEAREYQRRRRARKAG